MFLVDGSSSICNGRTAILGGLGGCDQWTSMANFIMDFVSSLDVGLNGSHVGVVLFSNSATTVVALDQ